MKKRLQMQKRRQVYLGPDPTQPIKEQRVYHKINQYRCDTCQKYITTAHVDEGTAPMFLNCRATPGCEGQMVSSMYRAEPNLVPTHEWYKPDEAEFKKLSPGMREHVTMGGVLLREVQR